MEKESKKENQELEKEKFEKLIIWFGFVTLSIYVVLAILILVTICAIIFWSWWWLFGVILTLALFLALKLYSNLLAKKLLPDFEKELQEENKKENEEKEKPIDYNDLTVNDLKLLLKSEGIPFSSSYSKEEIIEIILKNENIMNKDK